MTGNQTTKHRRIWRSFLSPMLAIAVMLMALLQPHSATSENTYAFDLAAYQLPDGSLPVLCQPGTGEEPDGHHVHCPLCIVSAQVVLPQSPDVSADIIFTARSFNLEPTRFEGPFPIIVSIGARGPPLLLV